MLVTAVCVRLMDGWPVQVTQSDSVEEQENSEDTMARIGSRSG